MIDRNNDNNISNNNINNNYSNNKFILEKTCSINFLIENNNKEKNIPDFNMNILNDNDKDNDNDICDR